MAGRSSEAGEVWNLRGKSIGIDMDSLRRHAREVYHTARLDEFLFLCEGLNMIHVVSKSLN